jgi:outer membrane lipoprotein SlyB
MSINDPNQTEITLEEPPGGAKTLAGATGGALLGWAVGGPAGAVVGGFLGLLMGASSEEEEQRKREW